MSEYREDYFSLDLDKRGVWLDMAVDDFGSARYWMTIEGQEIDLLEKEYRVLMEQRVEAHKASTEAERKRIIKLLEGYALKKCDVHCAYSCECFGKYEAQRFIALIKGEQK